MGKWKHVQKYADHIPSPSEHYLRNKDKATHILIIDATFTKVNGKDRAIIIAYDTGIGVVDYIIDVTENVTAYHFLFYRLDKVGYKPICVVSDGHISIKPAINDRNLPHQRCIYHLLSELKRKLTRNNSWEITGRNKILYSRIKGIFKTGKIENLGLMEKFGAFFMNFPVNNSSFYFSFPF